MGTEMPPEEQQDVFWIVGTGQTVRHATTSRPGAVYAGQSIPSLCDGQVKIPQPTPLGREPLTKMVTGRCADCQRKAHGRHFAETNWDF
ncbi:hypothetical protein GCM10009854_09500 [Saccharopolyspora halophila]|uniref:Uncharacterized protein n=2 Tax=Saccharopolyspora halophila TaxID=405551 RepID=A0ABN3FQZ5_9PSEU